MPNNQEPEIRLPGTGWKRVFKDEKEYRTWAEKFASTVRPEIEANEWRRIQSEHSARQHFVY